MKLHELPPLRQIARLYGELTAMSANAQAQNAVIAEAAATLGKQIETLSAAVASLRKPAPQADLTIHEAMGLRLLLDRNSTIDRAIMEDGAWEPQQAAYMAWLTNRLRGSGECVFLDIGSYGGLYSLLAHKSGTFNRIFAFESDPCNFAQLQANLFLNGAHSAIRAINKAVGEHDGQLYMWDSTSHPDGNRGGVGVVDEASGRPGRHVECLSIDSMLGLDGARILAKIDVEGFEPAVLRGMASTFAKNKVVAQVEIYDQNNEATMREIFNLGLRQIHRIYPDHYFTNMAQNELGI